MDNANESFCNRLLAAQVRFEIHPPSTPLHCPNTLSASTRNNATSFHNQAADTDTTVWHGVKGFRNSPYGERRIGGT